MCLFFQFYISCIALVLHFLFFTFVSYYVIFILIQLYGTEQCADVPLRNYSLALLNQSNSALE